MGTEGPFSVLSAFFSSVHLGPEPPSPRARHTETMLKGVGLWWLSRHSSLCLCPRPPAPLAPSRGHPSPSGGSPAPSLVLLSSVCSGARLCSNLALQKGDCLQRNVIKYTFALRSAPSGPGNTLPHPAAFPGPLSRLVGSASPPPAGEGALASAAVPPGPVLSPSRSPALDSLAPRGRWLGCYLGIFCFWGRMDAGLRLE